MSAQTFWGSGDSTTSITGWITDFFPYDKNGVKGNILSTDALPSGLTNVEFQLVKPEEPEEQQEQKLDFVSGYIGSSFDPETISVSPLISWYIRQARNDYHRPQEIVEDLCCCHPFRWIRMD